MRTVDVADVADVLADVADVLADVADVLAMVDARNVVV